MNENMKRISGKQLVCVLLTTRLGALVVDSLAFAPVEELNASFVLYMVAQNLLVFVLLLPLMLLHKAAPEENVLQVLRRTAGTPVAALVAVALIGYFLLTSSAYNAQFVTFVANSVEPNLPIELISLLILVTGIVVACSGIEAIGRTSTVLVVVIWLSFALLLVLTWKLADFHRLLPFEPDLSQWKRYVVVGAARNASLVMLFVLLPNIKGPIFKPVAAYTGFSLLLSTVMGLLMIAVFGRFLLLLIYPVYTLSALRDDLFFFRLDIVHTAIWLTGLIMQTGVAILCVALAVREFFKKVSTKVAATVTGVALYGVSSVIDYGQHQQLVQVHLSYLAIGFYVLGFGVSLLALVLHYVRKGKGSCQPEQSPSPSQPPSC